MLGTEKLWSSLADKIRAGWRGRCARAKSDADPEPVRNDGRNEEGKSFSRSRPDPAGSGKPVERILIYRLGSLGDTVVALPCLHKVAEVFPDAERYVLTNLPVSSKAAPLESILANSGLINGVVLYPVRLRSIARLWDLALRLRALEVSTLVYLMDFRGVLTVYRDLIFFRLCGVKHIIGAPNLWTLIKQDRLDADGNVEQECARLAATVAELGPVDLDRRASWDLLLTDAERRVAGDAVAPFGSRPFIAINMGGKVAQNHWGNENWRGLFVELAQTHGSYGLLVIGGADDASCVGEVTENWPSPVVNACGRLSPRESAAALERACLFIGHDSGPMHLAAASEVVCVALFSGNNPPRKWHPYGPRHRVIQRMDGIALIRVEEVAAAVRESLPAPASVKTHS
ncbi:glycosyltransferase family 9 protein [Methylocapsa polymorpha]|uniref:Glycosyltransferase family 9 protein n=1 Tax=Methylocapsa polymorpha TaxID=3080828 RepID=A0ABZ0HQR0_9HYPH|nr:glycosyltransferase family 9 protein [Methylocapsa sp. RX1]